jgi:DNA repair protein RadA/Sms
MGQCPSCRSWNTLVEEIITKQDDRAAVVGLEQNSSSGPIDIADIPLSQGPRLRVAGAEFTRVLGGGLVPGSVILIGGEPGIGKSTLLLQTALRSRLRTLYVSGEESEHQIRLRGERIGMEGVSGNCSILTETNTQQIFDQSKKLIPELVIIDSVQTLRSPLLESAPGSVGQIRECTAELIRYAKRTGIPVILVGHITKDGAIAGPKVLEHMVDCVLQFEGDHDHVYRLLRPLKNRFGSTNELGIYEMSSSGLIEVSDPSSVLIGDRNNRPSGVVVASSLEGMRPILIEVQALVSTAVYGTPQRISTGYDAKRLNMLLAVLEKRCGFRLGQRDVFLNLAGGIRIEEPAMDLAIIAAILSSSEDIPVDGGICFTGEVGLTGEIRPVTRTDQRISEARKLGFEKIVIPRFTKGVAEQPGIELIAVKNVEELVRTLFG